jgi:hypothetical protein
MREGRGEDGHTTSSLVDDVGLCVEEVAFHGEDFLLAGC